MCKWGIVKEVEVTMQPFEPCEYCKKNPEDKRCKGEWKKVCKIDKCIADIVEVLEYNNVKMRASCCGHGKGDGQILLNDRSILIIPIEFTSNKMINESD